MAGRVKTRLGADIGMAEAAELAAAALLRHAGRLRRGRRARHCHLAWTATSAGAVRSDELWARRSPGWTVRPQRGDDFGARLADAHAARCPGPVVQIGMDTPQVTPALLREAAAGLATHDAVLGPAEDGGWWVLALRDPPPRGRAGRRADVDAHAPTTTPGPPCEAAGLSVGTTATLRDVDTVGDADAVAAAAPGSRVRRDLARVRPSGP